MILSVCGSETESERCWQFRWHFGFSSTFRYESSTESLLRARVALRESVSLRSRFTMRSRHNRSQGRGERIALARAEGEKTLARGKRNAALCEKLVVIVGRLPSSSVYLLHE